MNSAKFARVAVASAALVLCGASLAQAAWAPVRPVEIVAPAGPGGGWDLLARTMQKVLTEEKILSVPVLVHPVAPPPPG